MSVASKTTKILKETSKHPKKRFGQNFLLNESILEGIVNVADVCKSDVCLEIGTGLGTLTEYLAKSAKRVLSYEIDEEVLEIAKENLKEYKNITYINRDFLDANLEEDISANLGVSEGVKVVANIPYYITTPIAIKLLKCKMISKIYLMMQKELALRFCASPKTKEYGSLSVLVAYFGKAKKVMNVSRNNFFPAPSVDSIILEIERVDQEKVENEEVFFSFIQSLFAQKRKTILNNLSSAGFEKSMVLDSLLRLRKKESARAEELSIEEIKKLYNVLREMRNV